MGLCGGTVEERKGMRTRRHHEARKTDILNESAHAGLRDASATEDLHGVLGSLLCAPGDVHLQQTDGTSELLRLVHV